MEPVLCSIADAARILGIGRTKTYELISENLLECVTIGTWRMAREGGTIEQLMEKVKQRNAMYPEPLPADEVLKIVASAWGYQVDGRNWVGGKGRATIAREEILAFPASPVTLRLPLKASHTGRDGPFAISQIEVAKLLGVGQPRMPGLITALIEIGLLRRVHQGRGKGDPHRYLLEEAQLAA